MEEKQQEEQLEETREKKNHVVENKLRKKAEAVFRVYSCAQYSNIQ